MGNMSSFEFIVAFAILMLAMTAVMALMFYTMQKKRESRYDEERKKIELDLLRHNVESEIYGLNKRLSKTSARFEDAYHLQLDGNKISIEKEKSNILLNGFLKSAGLKQSDLIEKDFVFVLTPFHGEFDEVYETIRSICEKADIRCIRGDEQNFKGDIFSHVLKNLVQAKVVIANLGGRNPNVLYELGLAHALDKTTILVSQLLDELPVDIKSKRVVTYKDFSDLKSILPVELLKAMK
ncbi:hypothetical protein CLM76_10870 [Vreelandella venusta]|nr:hypothetical protein CLM76_10870 [Halomonas hydrothermalis]